MKRRGSRSSTAPPRRLTLSRRYLALGPCLRLLRLLRRLTQAELARQSGVDQAEISRFENGKSLPCLNALGVILDVFGMRDLDFWLAERLVEQLLDDGVSFERMLDRARAAPDGLVGLAELLCEQFDLAPEGASPGKSRTAE
jgi:transcriptional regulator with XRE-family HTH domain